MSLFPETIGYFVHITNSKSVVRENNVSAAVTKSFAMFSVGRSFFGKRLTNYFAISVQHFKMSCLTLVR